jgi:D-alanine--poly(phosphoribitol) ligase subunit 1
MSTTSVTPIANGPDSLWRAFQRVVAATPSNVALALPDEDITFRDLHDDALACGNWLAGAGCGEGDVVALQLPKSRSAYVLWLACLRQGAIYAFLDPRNPIDRTAKIVDRLRPAMLVSRDDVANPCGAAVRLMEGDAPWAGRGDSVAAPEGRTHGLTPAYVMFTSGSTGEPKGAVIPQQGILNLMRWVRDWIPEPATQRFANLNPLHFDNAVFDLYCGLLNGATLVPIDTSAANNPLVWVKALRRHRASVLFAVPTLFMTLDRLRLLTPESLPDARTLIFGGEGFPIDALRRFHAAFEGRARLLNVYGPTETSCICSSLEIDRPALSAAGTGFASLGRMHDGFEFAILDDDQRPVGAGQIGELWIGGANVGLGYFGDADETQLRFRQDPRQNRYRALWYRAGDLVREDAQGLLWFHGRADNQVKIRGHRIELEEIDLALEALPPITRAIAVTVAGMDGPEIRAAFCSREALAIELVRAHCARTLPAYMQPAAIVRVDTLPTNANGKVDRRAARALLEQLT